MARPLSLACLVLASLALGAGCANGAGDAGVAADEADALVASSVTVADPKATEAAEVSEGSVRLPLAVAERYRALGPGSIFVGARGRVGGKNPDGFLRRVVKVSEDAGALVVTTTPATLTDAIVHGAVRTSSSAVPSIDGTGAQSLTPLTHKELQGIAIDFADEPLFDGIDEIDVGGKKARFVESIHLDHAMLTARPVVDIDLQIEEGRVRRFVAKVEGNVDTSVRASALVTAEGEIDARVLGELRARKHEVKRVIYQSPRIALPTTAVGGVPISPSVQLTVTLRCQLSFGGALVAHAGVEARSYVRLGAVYDGAAWGPPIRSDFDIKPSFTMERGGEVDARCAIEADAELSAYGTSSVTMSVAPYVDFGAESDGAPAPTYRFHAQAGANGAMHGRADVFGVKPEELERALVEWKSPEVLGGTAR